MPELPEVETIKIGLSKKIVGLKIKEIEVLSPKSFIIDDKEILEGKKVLKLERIAKYLKVNLSGDLTLLFHLKMTGQLIFVGSLQSDSERMFGGHPTPDMLGSLPNKHTRVIFTFSDRSTLYFNDQRRFGWIKIIQNERLKVQNLFNNLGPEPLTKDFTWQTLKKNLLRHKSMPIKVAIMDQKVVSGMGNIYANEACFNAKLNPRTKTGDLSDNQIKKLHAGIIGCLKDGIRYGGSTRTHFVDAEGRKGYFLDYAYVYGMDKKRCKKCGTEIKKIQLGGRGTYFCPKCQRAPD